MANNKKVTVDQLRKLAELSDGKFIDEAELEQALNELAEDSNCKYVLTANDTVTDVYGDGHAYQIVINSDFSTYAEDIYNGKTIWFDLSAVLNSMTLVSVAGFNVSANDEGYVLTGDCTLMDVWYHFTITSTTWPA